MALLDIWNAATSPQFGGRCTAGLWVVAHEVLSSPEAPERLKELAARVLRQRVAIDRTALAVAVMRHPPIGGLNDPQTATDAQILDAIRQNAQEILALL